jgi:TPR repeat protein
MYYYGYGVSKNKEKGIEYFKEAAGLNNTDGFYNYAMALLDNGGETNKQAATPYLNLAAYQGHTQAMFHLGR